MSLRAMTYCMELYADPTGRPITRTEKFVLLVLANYHNDAQDVAWPSLRLLAEQCLLSKPGLLTTLTRLQGRGLLAVVPAGENPGRGMVNTYAFPHLPPMPRKGKATLPFPDEQKGKATSPFSDQKGKVSDIERVKFCDQKGKVSDSPSIELLRNSSETKTTTGIAAQEPTLIQQSVEVLAELNKLTGMHFQARHPNGALTSNGRRVLAGLKNGYTADQLIRVVRLKCRAWMGGDMQKYLRPKTLFAPENFDQYVAGLRDNAPPVQTSGKSPT